MRRVAGPDAFRQVHGTWQYSSREDDAVRTVSILEKTPDGPRWMQTELRGLHQASKAGQVARAIHDGNWAKVRSFEGDYVTDTNGRRHYFATDRDALQVLDREGGLRPAGLRFT